MVDVECDSRYKFKIDINDYFVKVFDDKLDLYFLANYINMYLFSSNRDRCYLDKVISNCENMAYYSDSFFINLDVIAMGIDYQKNDFENFSQIVDDVSALVLKGANIDYYLNTVRPILNIILKDPNYKNHSNIRKYLISILMNLNKTDVCNSFINCFKFCEEKNVLDEDFYDLLEKEVKDYFPDRIIYEGEHYFYIINKLLKEDNLFFRKEILERFSSLSSSMFCDLNSYIDDSFIVFVDSVFDSDSYNELKCKLECMWGAHYVYNYGSLYNYSVKEIGLSNALSFYNRDFKDSYCGKVIAYPQNTMNVVEKPKRIIDRMKYLYRRIDGSISYDFIDELYKDAFDMKEITKDIEEEMKKRKSFLGRIKNKIKRKK